MHHRAESLHVATNVDPVTSEHQRPMILATGHTYIHVCFKRSSKKPSPPHRANHNPVIYFRRVETTTTPTPSPVTRQRPGPYKLSPATHSRAASTPPPTLGNHPPNVRPLLFHGASVSPSNFPPSRSGPLTNRTRMQTFFARGGSIASAPSTKPKNRGSQQRNP